MKEKRKKAVHHRWHFEKYLVNIEGIIYINNCLSSCTLLICCKLASRSFCSAAQALKTEELEDLLPNSVSGTS